MGSYVVLATSYGIDYLCEDRSVLANIDRLFIPATEGAVGFMTQHPGIRINRL